MASVFLSYDHEDAARAVDIASALEVSGHFVWWDRHIHGGAEYSSEIEGAVERADAVVVLWTQRSVLSAWVRDEAAEGRDRGKLIPIVLDGAKPPMGFRQFQTIDLSGWKGGKRFPQLSQLLRAIEQIVGRAPVEVHPPTTATDHLRFLGRIQLRRLGLPATGIAGLALLALSLWSPWRSTADTPSIAVVASDANPRARDLAGNLLVQLGSLQAAHADLLNLVERESGADADMIFKVAAVGGSADPSASLSLVDNRAGTLLWSREFVQPGGNEADLRQQLAFSAGQVLRCTTEALAPDHPKLELSTLKLYLGGCAELSTTLGDPRTSIPLFRKVTQQAPRFPGGWAKLIVADLEAFKATGASDPSLQNDLRADIEKARKVNSGMAEIYLALSWLQSPRPILGWMRFADEAAARNPDHAETLENHALGLLHVGRLHEAVVDARRAVEAEPLSSDARRNFIIALMDAGATEAASKELMKAERLWPGATNLLQTRFRLEANHGDARQAMRMLESGRLASTPSAAMESFLKARMEQSPANVERAIADARTAYRQQANIYPLVQALATFDRTDELAGVLLSSDPRAAPGLILVFFRPPLTRLRRDQRFMSIAERYGLIDYWRDSGKWPDFCFEPRQPYDCKKEAAELRA